MKTAQYQEEQSVQTLASMHGEKVSVGTLFATHYSVSHLMNNTMTNANTEKKDIR